MNGNFAIERSIEAHIAAYSALFAKLALHKVDFAGLVLKASMAQAGDKSGKKSTPEEIGEATVHVLSKTVPPLVPTIVFLSGGLSDADSIAALNAINKQKQKNPNAAPWALVSYIHYLQKFGQLIRCRQTFSFGRALQGVAMKSWSAGDIKKSVKEWVERAKWSSEASQGQYSGGCPS